ncbi:MAG: hypothetical protein COB53_11880 [Elusimicrobia bacterium]|nr:MAG: hypothetical protein COB53_11880 [Elusimicrobiota bacterium]
MCGRYTQTSDVKTLQKRFSLKAAPASLEPRINLTPGQMAPIIALKNGNRMGLFKWGLSPKWAKDSSAGFKMINARAETVAEKPAYKKPFQSQRCLVPADGFYEWKKDPVRGKVPFRFTLREERPFAFAGLWDNSTFTIITTKPNDLVKTIHDRMPVILPEEFEEAWLNPKTSPDRLHAMLAPFDAAAMRHCEVTPLKKPAVDQMDLF